MVSVEILLFSQPPSGKYEYINPCKYARSETAEQSDDELSVDDNGDEYEELSPQYLQSQPKASSQQLSLRPAKPVKPVPPSVPVKKRSSFENSSVHNSKTIGNYVTIKPCPDRPSLVQKKETKEPASGSSSTTRTPAKCTDDNLEYEVLTSLPNLSVKADDQTTKSRPDSDESLKMPPPQRQAVPLYAEVCVRGEPAKKQPPATKPKTFKRNPVSVSLSSADTGSKSATATRRVNSVKPFAGSQMSFSSQPSTSLGLEKKHWKSARDVPANLENLSVEQVGECLELLHLPKLAAEFRSQAVDGKLLVSIINEEILVTDFNCSRFKALQVVQFVHNGWRPNE